MALEDLNNKPSEARSIELMNWVNTYESLLYFKGNFQELPALDIIEIARTNIENRVSSGVSKRVQFLVVEIVQNAEKYSLFDDSDICDDVLITCTETEFIISVQNTIAQNKELELKEKLDHLNSYHKDDLRELYREAIKSNQLYDEGSKGAGLGFIEMLRKSGNPIAYSFKDVPGAEKKQFQVTLSIPLAKEIECKGLNDHFGMMAKIRGLQDNSKFGCVYSGLFTNDFLNPFLNLLDKFSLNPIVKDESIYKYVVIESVQNIRKHGLVVNGSKKGVVILGFEDDCVNLSTFNYVSESQKVTLNDKLGEISNMPYDELIKLQTKCLLNEEEDGGIGLLHLAMYSHDKSLNWNMTEVLGNNVFCLNCSLN